MKYILCKHPKEEQKSLGRDSIILFLDDRLTKGHRFFSVKKFPLDFRGSQGYDYEADLMLCNESPDKWAKGTRKQAIRILGSVEMLNKIEQELKDKLYGKQDTNSTPIN